MVGMSGWLCSLVSLLSPLRFVGRSYNSFFGQFFIANQIIDSHQRRLEVKGVAGKEGGG